MMMPTFFPPYANAVNAAVVVPERAHQSVSVAETCVGHHVITILSVAAGV